MSLKPSKTIRHVITVQNYSPRDICHKQPISAREIRQWKCDIHQKLFTMLISIKAIHPWYLSQTIHHVIFVKLSARDIVKNYSPCNIRQNKHCQKYYSQDISE